MIMTKHAETRCRQRGFPKPVIDIIINHGKSMPAPGGAIKVFFGNTQRQAIITDLKRALQMIDKAKNATLIVENDTIIDIPPPCYVDRPPPWPVLKFLGHVRMFGITGLGIVSPPLIDSLCYALKTHFLGQRYCKLPGKLDMVFSGRK